MLKQALEKMQWVKLKWLRQFKEQRMSVKDDNVQEDIMNKFLKILDRPSVKH